MSVGVILEQWQGISSLHVLYLSELDFTLDLVAYACTWFGSSLATLLGS